MIVYVGGQLITHDAEPEGIARVFPGLLLVPYEIKSGELLMVPDLPRGGQAFVAYDETTKANARYKHWCPLMLSDLLEFAAFQEDCSSVLVIAKPMTVVVPRDQLLPLLARCSMAGRA